MLHGVRLRNFKSIEDIRLRLPQFTILVGPNDSGKSSILQALVLLKQSIAAGNLSLGGALFDFGSYSDIVTFHDSDREVTIGVAGSCTLPDRVTGTLGLSNDRINYSYEMTFKNQVVTSNNCWIQTGPWQLAAGIKDGKKTAEPKSMAFGGANFQIDYSTIRQPIYVTGARHPEDVADRIQSLLPAVNYLTQAPVQDLGTIFFVPANRSLDRPALELIDKELDDLAFAGSASKQASAVASMLAYRRELEGKVSGWLKRITGASVSARARPLKQVAVEAETDHVRTNIVHEGFGSNQLVFLLLQAALSHEGSVLLIEEPELNLHPKAQSELAQVLVEIATAENKQIILTTHSEHILFRILNNVAEGKLNKEGLALHYFQTKGRIASSQELLIDNRGMVKGGLPGFFEADVAELQNFLKSVGANDAA